MAQKYFLSDEKGSCIAQVESEKVIKAGDEVNWRGFKLSVKAVYSNVLVVEKIGGEVAIDDRLTKMINDVFSWSQSIRREAHKYKADGIDDSALIIQETLEGYISDYGINPSDVIDYSKHGKRTYGG